MKHSEPMPTVAYDNHTYKLRSRTTEPPNFATMSRLEALTWLCRYTTPRGYSRKVNPLAGLAGVISIASSPGRNS